jgi:PAS domain S-box-containing protein
MQPDSLEEPIRQSECELIIETIPDAVMIVDHSGIITVANRIAETILGVSCSEMYTRTYDAPVWNITTVEGNFFSEDKLSVSLVLKYGKPVYGAELAIEHPNKKRVILSVNAVPLFNEKATFQVLWSHLPI